MQQASDIQLVGIAPPWVEIWWEPVRSLVESACSRSGGRYALLDILHLLLSGRMQLWVAMEGHEIIAIAITELCNYPQLRECRVLAATGDDARTWDHLIEKIEAWATQQDCRKIVCITRPGWEKHLKEYGYKKTHIYLEKDLGYVH